MPRVTVLMPSYNHEKYIAQAIQSVLDQTYQDFELVITDDGSSDGTVSEIRKFKDPRIRLFTFKENQGAAVANLNNIAEAKGEYFAMLSSDDIFMPDKLEKQVKLLDERPEIWAVFTYPQAIDENGDESFDEYFYNYFNQPNRTRFEWLNYFFFKGNALCHPSVLTRTDVYTDIFPPDPRFAQTGDFIRWIKLCMKHDIYIMPEKLIKFRLRDGNVNVSGNRPEAIKRTIFEFSQIYKNYLEIETIDEFLKIFPEALKKWDNFEKDLIPFYISQLSTEIDNYSSAHQLFAFNVLFDLLSNKDIAMKLEQKYGFRYIDFIELTGKYDPFNIQKINDVWNGLVWKDKQIEEYNKQIEEYNKQIQELLNSYSWKITSPFRKVYSILRGSRKMKRYLA